MRFHTTQGSTPTFVADIRPQPVWMMLLPLAISFGCCVKEGTLIDTPDGKVPVELIQVGQTVYSQDSAGRQVESRVTGVKKSLALSYLEIENESHGHPLCVTAWHPVKTPSGWTRAGSLSTGGSIQTKSGQHPIENIRLVPKICNVYDLSVEPHRNFIANGVVVHNKSIAAPANRDQIIDTWYAIYDRAEQTSILRYQFNEDGTVMLERVYWYAGAEPRVTSIYRGKWTLNRYTLSCELTLNGERDWDEFCSFEAIVYAYHFGTINGINGLVDETQITLHRESAMEEFLESVETSLDLLGIKRQLND